MTLQNVKMHLVQCTRLNRSRVKLTTLNVLTAFKYSIQGETSLTLLARFSVGKQRKFCTLQTCTLNNAIQNFNQIQLFCRCVICGRLYSDFFEAIYLCLKSLN